METSVHASYSDRKNFSATHRRISDRPQLRQRHTSHLLALSLTAGSALATGAIGCKSLLRYSRPPTASYWLFLYTTKPPIKIANMTPINIMRVSITSSFPGTKTSNTCVRHHIVLSIHGKPDEIAASNPHPEAARRGRLGRLEHIVCIDEDPHEE